MDRLSIDGRNLAAATRARDLALEARRRAYEERPDHPSSHELYAFALVRAKRHGEAFGVLSRAIERTFPAQVRGVRAVFESDLMLVGAAWIAAQPDKRLAIAAELDFGLAPASQPSLRFALTWETDANDVDLYLDPAPALAANSKSQLLFPGRSWLEVADGFGPDVFVIDGPKPGLSVRLGVHQARVGPTGYTFGNVEVIRHDGSGRLTFEQRPFALMTDQGYADLGPVRF